MSENNHEPVEVSIPIEKLVNLKELVIEAILAKVYFDDDFEVMKQSVNELRLAALKDVDVFLGKYCDDYREAIMDECYKTFSKVFKTKPGYEYDELD